MRFKSLRVSNLRAIRDIEMVDLKDFIVIAGPNGCGKSCVFDAIRLLKSSYGGYQAQEHMQWFAELGVNPQERAQIFSVFRDRSLPLEVSAVLTFSENEKKFMLDGAEELLWPIAWQQVSGQATDYWTFSRIAFAQLAQYQNAVRPIVDEMKKQLAIELTQDDYSVSLTITPGGEFVVTPCLPATISFGAFEPEHLGIIEYHSASRAYTRQPLQGINLNARDFQDQRRQQTLYNAQAKYQNIKTELASGYLRALIQQVAQGSAAEDDLNETLKELFQTFFPDKTYDGVQALPGGGLSFPVTVPGGGTHDIDDLSSGEKEILYGYLRLRNSTPKSSVLLLDEPELHLNPSLLAGFADFYHRNLGVARDNQLWLVTHSDALLRQAVGNVNYVLYHMHAATADDGGNQLSEVLLDSDAERVTVDLVGDLAAYRPHAKVVILEGVNRDAFDEAFIRRLFPDFAKRVNLVSGGAKQRVKDLWEVLSQSSEQSGMPNRFFAVMDKDTDSYVAPDASSTTFTWDAYHIENYLLDLSSIDGAMKTLAPDKALGSLAEVKAKLRSAAETLVDQLVLHRLRVAVNSEIVGEVKLGGKPEGSAVAESLVGSITGSIDRINSVAAGLTIDALERRADAIRATYAQALETDAWLIEFPGRDILKAFIASTLGDVKYETFRNVVVDQMQRSEIRPSGIEVVVKQILAR